MKNAKDYYHVSLRGLLGVPFSLGLDALQLKTQKLGIKGEVFPFTAREQVHKTIVQRYKAGLITGPVIISGHSLGAVESVRLAKSLILSNVPVAAVFLLDYVWTLSNALARKKNKLYMPLGVGYSCQYQSRDGRVINCPSVDETVIRYDLSHIQLDDDADVHKDILEKIERYCK